MSRLPQWKQRAIAAQREADKAKREERYRQFWTAVEAKRFFEDQPDSFVKPAVIGEEYHGPIG